MPGCAFVAAGVVDSGVGVATAAGNAVQETRVVAGIRLWFRGAIMKPVFKHILATTAVLLVAALAAVTLFAWSGA